MRSFVVLSALLVLCTTNTVKRDTDLDEDELQWIAEREEELDEELQVAERDTVQDGAQRWIGGTPRECLINKDGYLYRGTKSTTAKGQTCDNWTKCGISLLTRSSEYTTQGTGDHNYCRGVYGWGGGEEDAWCYVKGNMEKCGIPKCTAEQRKQETKVKWCKVLAKKSNRDRLAPLNRWKSREDAQAYCELRKGCTAVKQTCWSHNWWEVLTNQNYTENDWYEIWTPCKTGKFTGVLNDYLN